MKKAIQKELKREFEMKLVQKKSKKSKKKKGKKKHVVQSFCGFEKFIKLPNGSEFL